MQPASCNRGGLHPVAVLESGLHPAGCIGEVA